MLDFQNNCRRSNEKLQMMKKSLEQDADDSLAKIEILEEIEILGDFDSNGNVIYGEEDILGSENESFDEVNYTSHVGNISSSPDPNFTENTEENKSFKHSPQKIACHICGKLYEVYKMKYHLNTHNGTCTKLRPPIFRN